MENKQSCWMRPMFWFGLVQLVIILSHSQAQLVSNCLDGCLCTKQRSYSIRYVDCSNRKLTKIPSGSLGWRDYLILKGNSITTIKHSDFQNYTRLYGLDIRDNPIENITSTVFFNLQSLRILMISAKNIHHFAFHGLSRLSILRIEGNGITSLPVTLLRPFSRRLYNFTLTNTQVKVISTHVLAGMTNLRYVDLRHNKIQAIGNDAFHGSVRLYRVWLGHNQLKKLPFNIQNHQYLNLLDVSYNNISAISQTNFQGLVRLWTLDLSNNQISELDEQEFSGIPLRYLKLQNNKLTSVPNKLLRSKCTVLLTLDLSNNLIETFNFSSTTTCQLNTLKLAGNPLVFVNVLGFSRLQTLDLSNNCYLNFSQNDVFTFGRRLTTIDMSDSCLRTLPKFLSSPVNRFRTFRSVNLYGNILKNLTVPAGILSLNISSNGLENITFNYWSYRRYGTYDLSKNHLSTIGRTSRYGRSMRLSRLYLSKNSFTAFNMPWIIYITTLDMSFNKLKSFDSRVFRRSFWYSRNIRTLNLRGNLITELNETVLSRLRFLRNLDLSQNLITKVEDDALRNQNRYVRYLNISGNKLTRISKEISTLANLRMIDLSDNMINNISESTFNGMRYITKIYVKRNRLTSLPAGLTRFTQGLRNKLLIDFSGNQLSCSCDLTVLLSSSQSIHPIGECKGKNGSKPLHEFVLSLNKLQKSKCNLCPMLPCKYNGKCVADSNNGFRCECYKGYTGSLCEVAHVDCLNGTCSVCTATTCQNGGTCIEGGGNTRCQCPSGYSGDKCQSSLCTPVNPCKNNGVCSITGNNFQCQCSNGYIGTTCEVLPNGKVQTSGATEKGMSKSLIAAVTLVVLLAIAVIVLVVMLKRHGFSGNFGWKKAFSTKDDKVDLSQNF